MRAEIHCATLRGPCGRALLASWCLNRVRENISNLEEEAADLAKFLELKLENL